MTFSSCTRFDKPSSNYLENQNHTFSWGYKIQSLADDCSNAVTCNGVTVFVTFSVLFCVFDYIFRKVFVTGIEYKIPEVFIIY